MKLVEFVKAVFIGFCVVGVTILLLKDLWSWIVSGELSLDKTIYLMLLGIISYKIATHFENKYIEKR
ncbi:MULTISPECIES: hypothetical protein [Streptococcus]|uniref:Bacteriocin immunity protein n=1 Tax=Streptococcus caledonicus TaxID=2614158 RepID=A0ABW0UID3_9STRE|nr:hypothetical protein [Streptococcus sp. S784/96/1]